MSEVESKEAEVERSRAKLDLTLEELESRLTTGGITDEVIGKVRNSEYGSMVDEFIEVVRRNPAPVLIAAIGIGWLATRFGSERLDGPRKSVRPGQTAPVPVDPTIRRTDTASPASGYRGARTGEKPAVREFPTA